MKITRKRILALNLAFLMLLTLLLPVSAADITDSTEYCTLTINGGDGTTINGAHEMTVQIKKNTPFMLDDFFHKDNAYVDHYLRATDSGTEEYGRNYIETSNDTETLTVVWATSQYKIPLVYVDMEGKKTVIDGGVDNWTLPELEDTVRNGKTDIFLGWDTNSKPYFQIHANTPQKALTRTRTFYANRTWGYNGIVFDFSGEIMNTYNNGEVYTTREYVFYGNCTQTERFTGLDRIITGWNTARDGSGTAYAVSGETVAGADTGVVRLYAQYPPEGTIPLTLTYATGAGTEMNSQTLYVTPGKSVELPTPPAIDGQKLSYWGGYYAISDNRAYAHSVPAGDACVVPSNATRFDLTAMWLPDGPLVIDGKSYTVEDTGWIFHDDADGKTDASYYYDMEHADARLYLASYNGGPISLPSKTKVTNAEDSHSVITATDGVALSCGGILGLYTSCVDNAHGSLTIKGAPNSAAVSAIGVIADYAAHTTIQAGTGGSVAGAENLFRLNDNFTYTCQTAAGSQTLAGDEGGFATLSADATSLKIEPNKVTLTVNGGGATANGQATITREVESAQTTTLDSLGFTWPGHFRTGFDGDADTYEVTCSTSRSITLDWVDTGYDKFLALDLNGEQAADESQYKLFKDSKSGKTVLFLDYSADTLKIPDVSFANSNSETYYWMTAINGYYEIDQFLSGETVNKEQLPEGSTLFAKTSGTDRNIYYAFYANGKTFSGGRRVITRSSNYLPKYTASDGANIYYYSTDPEGKADRYTPGEYADLSRGTKLYAIWLPVGSVPVTIENRANDETNETFAEAGGTITLPTPQAKDGLTFAYWGCSIRLTDGNYTWSELKAGENLPIPEKAAEVRILACWSLNKQVTVNGKSYSFTAKYAYQHDDDNGWWIWYDSQKVKLTLTLDGYHGGSIELPVLADVSVKSTSTINGTLSCADTLRIITECAYGQHSNLTVQAAAGAPALVAPRVYFDRAPHVTLTAGAGAKAIAAQTGTPDVTGNDKVTYHGKTDAAASAYTQLTMTEMGLQGVEDLQVFHTEPRMSKLTIDGAGGKTAAGKTSTTVDLEYGEGYSLRATGFKKQYSDVVGFVENTGTDTYHYYEWPKSIRVQSPAVTLKINWRELGYPYLAFRADDGILKGEELSGQSRVVYVNRNKEHEVAAPDYVYADAVSNGDLVYWFSSEDGTETDSSRQYLAGEVVSEPDDTTLYARAIRSGQVALVAPGTTFSNGKHVVVSNTLKLTTLKSKEGKTIESWNTEPDGTGKSFARDAELQYETPRILYAQWKTNLTVVPETDPETEEKVLQIQQKTDSDAEKVEIKDTSPKEIAFEQAKRVILAAYENGRFVGMVNATASGGVITCRVPAQYVGCELKLFFMEGGKPKQDMEIIRLPAEE